VQKHYRCGGKLLQYSFSETGVPNTENATMLSRVTAKNVGGVFSEYVCTREVNLKDFN